MHYIICILLFKEHFYYTLIVIKNRVGKIKEITKIIYFYIIMVVDMVGFHFNIIITYLSKSSSTLGIYSVIKKTNKIDVEKVLS